VSTRIGPEPIDPAAALAEVADAACGGIAMFLGVVRGHSEGARVTAIDYEAYAGMAIRVLEAVETDLRAKWPLGGVCLWHRTGRHDVGEASVLVAVSAPHRAEAFEACREGIERIKAELPVWKREYGANGAVWKEETPLRVPEAAPAPEGMPAARRKRVPSRKRK
jgi:molybdopterin synthase catalytic subunit